MRKIKLNLASGTIQERNLITAFKNGDIIYAVFDGDSVGTMGLPVILVSKESLGKVTGINDPEEWKTTKECLKKIIDGQEIEYAKLDDELKADDIFFRQLTLPVESFEALKKNYVEPEEAPQPVENNDTPVFDLMNSNEVISPISNDMEVVVDPTISPLNNLGDVPSFTPVMPDATIPAPTVEASQFVPDLNAPANPVSDNMEQPNAQVKTSNYEQLKTEFLAEAEKLFDSLYNKINHND